jgi:hypothetical protein
LRRASILAATALAATGAMAFAGAASAQSAPTAGQAQGLRYLSWQGRGEVPASATPDAVQPVSPRADLRRPNSVIPHGGFAASQPPASTRLTSAPGPARRTLTPANAWLQPRAAPPEPTPAPAAAAPPPPTTPPATRPTPGPEYLPDQGRRAQPAPAEAIYPAPEQADEVSAAPVDPMAPRRDAPVFRMQQTTPQPQTAPAPTQTPAVSPRAEASRSDAPAQPRRVMEVANSGEAPPRQGGRYYSVHRQNGREPDTLTLPEPTYVDALVVSSIDTLASQDLAEPEPGPTLIRDRNGSMRPVAAAPDGDYQ